MEHANEILSTLLYFLNTKRKRHIVGGVLMSVSLLFAGLALTVVTLSSMEEDEENE